MSNNKQDINHTELNPMAHSRRGFFTVFIAGISTSVSSIFRKDVAVAENHKAFTAENKSMLSTNNQSFFFPGELLASDEMRITIVGSSSVARKTQSGTSIFLELGNGDSFIFDAGPGVAANYTALGVPYSRMDRIFLSHLHCDHITDLAYIYGQGSMYDRKTPLRIWGPSGKESKFGTNAFVESMKAMCLWHTESLSYHQNGNGYETEVHEFDYAQNPGVAYNEKGVVIKHFPAVHLKDGAVSYRVDWNGLSFVFSGDSQPNTFMVENAQNVDILIHQTIPPAQVWAKEYNMPLEQVIELQNRFDSPPHAVGAIFDQTRPRLGVLTHLYLNENIKVAILDSCQEVYDGPIEIAQDLMVFNISKNEIKQRIAIVPELALQNTVKKYENLPPPKYKPREQLSQWLLDAVIPQEQWK
ncbi:guanitoxin biosynthesis MBL fold metallo-hydrolase GntH [Sphaerospermopsis torques-reginae]|jgi:ribonuclease Z|uniref:MBL fold metallo-hydrolase n=1 Tax=Sphaerospermopsis torques-reginae ITEP-024 TaxID=984208 RepID=A0ABX8WVP1_9CYAN|nr:guanitoxin biosynthesis MBL fold metallo-hydrolase GntH [Sphaerospermopsis torques-reginae]QYX30488.1 MBL fold metallo-hydrolase [Sphaerospermopsis torques-reginae ITEP-024]